MGKSYEDTGTECVLCGEGTYQRHLGNSTIYCDNCFHAPPDDIKRDRGYEVNSRDRPRYKNSGNLVMDGAFTYLGGNDVVWG